MRYSIPKTVRRIGFVSTRIAGTDGVSLETRKWAEVLSADGYECFYITGESDLPEDRTELIEEAHFRHPAIEEINRRAFSDEYRDEGLTDAVLQMSRLLRDKLKQAIRRSQVDILIAENCLAIPMNLPLGLALVYVIEELGIPCIAHHHDFHWERDRYLVNNVNDFIRAAFPPALRQIEHVAINTPAAEDFCRRTGLSCRIIPNVMNFAVPPSPPDEYARQFRRTVGMSDDELFVLQPTRVVPRKGIEHSIELLRWLDDLKATLVITHASGDEGDSYARRVRRFADLLGVRVIFAERWVSSRRGLTSDGEPIFTIEDIYPQADLVTYPSTYEGFGNAFLEAVYFKRPIVCNQYAIYRTDLRPAGFRTILMDGYLTEETVAEVRHVLDDPDYRRELVEQNYEVGKRFFSYDVVRDELRSMLRKPHAVCWCDAD